MSIYHSYTITSDPESMTKPGLVTQKVKYSSTSKATTFPDAGSLLQKQNKMKLQSIIAHYKVSINWNNYNA